MNNVFAIKIQTIFARNQLNLTKFTCCGLSLVSFTLSSCCAWSETRCPHVWQVRLLQRRLSLNIVTLPRTDGFTWLFLFWWLNLRSSETLETGITSTSSAKVLKSGNISPTCLSLHHQVDGGGNCNPSKWQMTFRFVRQILKKETSRLTQPLVKIYVAAMREVWMT